MDALNQKLSLLEKQNGHLKTHADKGFHKNQKELQNMKTTTQSNYKQNDPISVHSHFLHSSEAFSLPIQNWKNGTPFYREKIEKEIENKHSAKILRAIPCKLSNEESEMIMEHRFQLALVERPLHGGVYKVIPYHHEPLHFSHLPIWKMDQKRPERKNAEECNE